MRTVTVTRYLTPLREGGSVPAVVEADDLGTYVLKFRGAAQGPKALIAELVGGEIGRALGLPVPEIVFAELDPVLGRSEPDPEIQDLVTSSGGLNLALDFLPGAFGFDPYVGERPDPRLASSIVWFDALISNVDRTVRNPNLLVWHKRLYLIDHGAALYFHHLWDDYLTRARAPFAQINGHVLLRLASQIEQVDEALASKLGPSTIAGIVDLIPDAWLGDEPAFASLADQRAAYAAYLLARLTPPRAFATAAAAARAAVL